MANTYTSAISATLQTEVGSFLIQEARENAIIASFAEFIELPQGYATHGFARMTSTAALTAITSGANEADAQTASGVTATTATVTPAVKAAFVVQSWLSIRTSAINWKVEVPKILGRAAAQLIDSDCGALLGGFSSTSGVTNVAAGLSDLRQAVYLLRTVALGAAEMGAVFILHPKQINDVDTELQSGSGAGLATMMQRSDLVNWYGAEPSSGMLNNFRGSLMGIPVFSSANVPTANAAVDRAGALFLPQMAMGGAYSWLPQVEEASAIVTLQVANVTAITCAYAFVEKKDEYGVSVITKA